MNHLLKSFPNRSKQMLYDTSSTFSNFLRRQLLVRGHTPISSLVRMEGLVSEVTLACLFTHVLWQNCYYIKARWDDGQRIVWGTHMCLLWILLYTINNVLFYFILHNLTHCGNSMCKRQHKAWWVVLGIIIIFGIHPYGIRVFKWGWTEHKRQVS